MKNECLRDKTIQQLRRPTLSFFFSSESKTLLKDVSLKRTKKSVLTIVAADLFVSLDVVVVIFALISSVSSFSSSSIDARSSKSAGSRIARKGQVPLLLLLLLRLLSEEEDDDDEAMTLPRLDECVVVFFFLRKEEEFKEEELEEEHASSANKTRESARACAILSRFLS